MSDVGNAIGAAYAAIQAEEEEDAMRTQYRTALKILQTIPSGTHDDDLTDEQRKAWKDHDAALAWLRGSHA